MLGDDFHVTAHMTRKRVASSSMDSPVLPPLNDILNLARLRPDFPYMTVTEFLNDNVTFLSSQDSKINDQIGGYNTQKRGEADRNEFLANSSETLYEHDRPLCKPKFWSYGEEQKLQELVQIYGKAWTKISSFLENRTPRQIRLHWTVVERQSHTKVSRTGFWSEDEDALLLEAAAIFGKDWEKISSRVPGRNRTQCKKRLGRINRST